MCKCVTMLLSYYINKFSVRYTCKTGSKGHIVPRCAKIYRPCRLNVDANPNALDIIEPFTKIQCVMEYIFHLHKS